MAYESQAERRGKSKGISILGHGMTENAGMAIRADKNSHAP
jgi:hypothetical protein